MPNLMQRSATWISDRMQAVAGRTITYIRGPATSVTAVGVPVEERYKTVGDDGCLTWFHSTDWCIAAADLDELTPRPGDRISETLNGDERVYEVLPISDAEPCFKPTDTSGIRVTVHTKRIQ